MWFPNHMGGGIDKCINGMGSPETDTHICGTCYMTKVTDQWGKEGLTKWS